MAPDPPAGGDPPLDPAIAGPVQRFMTSAAQAATTGPGPSQSVDDGEDLGYPTVVSVELGEDYWSDTPVPESELLPVPVSSPVPVPANLSRTPAPGTMALNVQLGDRTLMLRPTEDALWGYLTLAFRLGGFGQVILARKAIDAAVAELERAADEADGAAGRDVAARNEAERQLTSEPLGQAPGAAAWRAGNQAADSGRQSRQQRAQASAAQWFKVTFNELWAGLAVLEEACLRQWEEIGVREYDRILEAHMGRANQQWIRYGCYLNDKPNEPAKISESRGKGSSVRVKLDRGSAGSAGSSGTGTGTGMGTGSGTGSSGTGSGTGPVAHALPTLDDLRKRALELNEYAKEIIPAAIKSARIHASRGDPVEAQLYADHLVKEIQEPWAQRLMDAEESDAVLLQIYRDVDKDTTLDQVERLIVDALLDAYHLSNDLRANLIRLVPVFGTLRIQPGPLGDDPNSMYGLSFEQRSMISSTVHGDAVALGLAIPASVVLSVKLQEEGASENSAWMHLAVRHAATCRILSGRLRGLLDMDSLSERAITHALDEFESFRERDKDRFSKWSLGVIVLGLALAPFTGGGSAVVAGLVAASFQVAAFIEEYGRVKSAQKLSAASLDALEIVLWTRPSRLALYRMMLSSVIEVGQAIFAPELPLVADMIITAVSWSVAPGEQPSRAEKPMDPSLFAPAGAGPPAGGR
jgi:hypothetical protein